MLSSAFLISKRKKQNQKRKNLFQHLNQVTAIQNPDYWDTLTEDDIKTWSNYMIHRFLSMKMEWIDLVNEFISGCSDFWNEDKTNIDNKHKNILNHFAPDLDFTWKDVLELRKSHPDYFEANTSIKRNAV